MLTVCHICKHDYNQQRERCPACGTPQKKLAPRNPMTHKVARSDDCSFCGRRGAKESCIKCRKLLHHQCVNLHLLTAHKGGRK